MPVTVSKTAQRAAASSAKKPATMYAHPAPAAASNAAATAATAGGMAGGSRRQTSPSTDIGEAATQHRNQGLEDVWRTFAFGKPGLWRSAPSTRLHTQFINTANTLRTA